MLINTINFGLNAENLSNPARAQSSRKELVTVMLKVSTWALDILKRNIVEPSS